MSRRSHCSPVAVIHRLLDRENRSVYLMPEAEVRDRVRAALLIAGFEFPAR